MNVFRAGGNGMRVACMAAACAMAAAGQARGQTATVPLESFENTLDGWSIHPDQASNFTNTGFSTTTGVTNGSYALQIGPTATNTGSGPSYQILLTSPGYGTAYAQSLTQTLSTATSVSFDIFAPYQSFGYYLQFELAAQTNAAGYPYLGLNGFTATNLGQETTLTIPITPAENQTFAADAASGVGTVFDLQVGGGYTAGNETFDIDNFVADVPVSSPEPTSICLLGLPAAGLLARRARRR